MNSYDVDDIIDDAWQYSLDSDVPDDESLERVIDNYIYGNASKSDIAKVMKDVKSRLDVLLENDKNLLVNHTAMEILSTFEEMYSFDDDQIMEKIYNELQSQEMSRARAQERYDAIERHLINAITIYQGVYRERMRSKYGESWWLHKEDFDESKDF